MVVIKRMVLGAIFSFDFCSVSSLPVSVTRFAYSPAIISYVDISSYKFVTFIAMRLPCVLSGRCLTSHNVRYVVYWFDMVGVYASSYSAQVVAVKPIYIFTSVVLVHNPMRSVLFSFG